MRAKVGSSAHRNIFFIAALCILSLLVAAIAVERRDRARHAELYARYEEANGLYASSEYAEAYVVYAALAPEYPKAYILELKAGICAVNMGNVEEGAARLARVLEMYPLYARDVDYMAGFAYTLNAIGAQDEARRVEDYIKTIEALPPLESPAFETE